MEYRLKSKPIKIVNIPEEYKKEAGRLVEMVSEMKNPLGLLKMDNEYPLLKDMTIFTQAQLLVNPVYSKERVQELQDELFIKVCEKLKERYLEEIKEREARKARIEKEMKEVYDRVNYSSNRTYRGDLK